MIDTVIKQYFNKNNIESIECYGNGHINKTFLVTLKYKKYILQEINTTVFKNPWGVMRNIEAVTKHLKKKAVYEGKDPNRAVLNVVYTKDDKEIIEIDDHYFRCYEFIEKAVSFERIDRKGLFYETGKAVGEFQKLLMDFDSNSLYESIRDFHNTPKRFIAFENTLIKDEYNRRKDCEKEIQFILERKDVSGIIIKLLDEKKIPLRVTHNDTKLNNVMFDEDSLESLCLIDLDTVMPGSVLFDYGDALRIGASNALEDEENLDLVTINLDLFEEFSRGFLEETCDILNEEEINNLINGYRVITLECGMRFLTDYLNGDKYFRIKKENHNLIRARNQLKLVEEIEKNTDKMSEIIKKIIGE